MRFAEFVVKHSRMIEKVFILLSVISIICIPFVGINYDMSKYLPDDMPSKQGIDLMEQEFGYPGTARVMIDDVSVYEAKLYKEQIAAIDGVDMVLWADSLTEVYQSGAFLAETDLSNYYNDEERCAIMDVTFVEDNSAKLTWQAVGEIQELLGEKGHYGGPAVQNKFQSEATATEMGEIMVMGIAIITAILLLSTTSWFAPVIFLLVIAVAIVINLGSNLIIGEISSMTISVAAVLQLAIAMDYTIILLDNYTRESLKGASMEEALTVAIRKSLTPIASAGSAAIVGFLALVLMRFSIGADIGLILAKGIFISLFTVVLLMPALLLRWHGKVEKCSHRLLVPSFDRLAQKVNKSRFVLLVVILLLVVPSYVGKGMTDYTFGNDSFGLSEGTEVYEDTVLMNQRFGRSNLLLAIVPIASGEESHIDPRVTEERLTKELESLEYMGSVQSLAGTLPQGIPESFLPDSLTGQLHTEDYARILCSLRTASESPLAFAATEEVESIVKKYYPEGSYVVGETPSTMDIKAVVVDDYRRVDLLSLLGVALAVMLAFRNLLLPVALIIPIQCAVFINMAVPYLMGEKLMFMGYVVVACLQLGATIDYSIVMTYHYMEYREQFDKKTAAIKATASSCLPILTSGLILSVAGYGVFLLSSITAVSDLGHLIGRGALFSILLVIGMLPNLFIWMDRPLMAGRWGKQRRSMVAGRSIKTTKAEESKNEE